MYQAAIQYFPTDSSIHLKYAGFLRHVRKNIDGAEKEYLAAIAENSKNADALGNYASFLHGVRRNSADAEKFYKMAVELDDSHANNLCNYGLFLRYRLLFEFISSLIILSLW
jgi:Tfp pilus assembly protein PilF